jgi:UDP-N-acetylmuramate dehydrogenase
VTRATVPPAVLDALAAACADVRREEPLHRHVSFRIGGPAEVLVAPRSAEELRAAARILFGAGVPFAVLGRGSNILISDRGVRGVVLKIGHGLDRARWSGNGVTAEAGAGLPALAMRAAEKGLGGLEFAAGIPASVGGAVAMNAGAHGHSMDEVTESVTVLRPNGEATWRTEDLGFAYRASRLQSELGIVIDVTLRLAPADPERVRALLGRWLDHRARTQPIGPPSSGCIFRNPAGDAAGRLIDAAGAKGLRRGGVAVSNIHANYVINAGGGRADDVLALAELVRARVRSQFGVDLELEVKLLGDFPSP